MSGARWVSGNAVRLLENGEEYFPRLFELIRAARVEVLIETFILAEDEVGHALQAALIEAAARGVSIDLTVDGWGSIDLSEAYIGALTAAGVRVNMVDRRPRVLGLRPNVFRRLHRKMAVIDGRFGFIGGINYSREHLLRSGERSKLDWMVEVQGPIVEEMQRFMRAALAPARRGWRRLWGWMRRRQRTPPRVYGPVGPVAAQLVQRDNHHHRNDIKRHYLAAIRAARTRILIANAYFLPGLRLLRQLARAARRGVRVDLILQGKPDMAMAVWGTRALTAYLTRSGVRVHGFCERPLHGKVAVVDEDWVTVGSSNLDPFSLAFNLEANLVLRDRAFASHLGERLERLIAQSCEPLLAPRTWLTLPRVLLSATLFHLLRWISRLALALPPHRPSVAPALAVTPAAPNGNGGETLDGNVRARC